MAEMAAHPCARAERGWQLPLQEGHRPRRSTERQDDARERAVQLVAVRRLAAPPRARPALEVQDRRHRPEPRHRARALVAGSPLVQPGAAERGRIGSRDSRSAGGDQQGLGHQRQGVHPSGIAGALRDPRRQERPRKARRTRPHGRAARAGELGRVERHLTDHQILLERSALGNLQRRRRQVGRPRRPAQGRAQGGRELGEARREARNGPVRVGRQAR